MSLLQHGIVAAADDVEVVTKSCRFDGTAAYLSRTFGTPTDNDKWTWACWVKRAEMDTLQVLFGSKNISGAPVGGGIYFNTDNTLEFYDSASGANFKTSAVFRDPASWMHLCVTLDTAGGDAAIYVNGDEVTAFATSTEPSGTGSSINSSGEVHHIAREVSSTGYFAGVCLADMYFVDGSIVAPKGNFTNSPATDANGQLKPKAYTGSLGTNGFHLDFKDNGSSGGNLGYDAAGSNHLTASGGLLAHDQLNDRPTNNYAVLNELANTVGTLSEGSTKIVPSYADKQVYGSFGIPLTNKWYWEVCVPTVGSRNWHGISDTIGSGNNAGRGTSAKWAHIGVYSSSAIYANTGATVNTHPGAASTGDVYAFAFEPDAGKLWIEKNATPDVSGTPTFSGLDTTVIFFPWHEETTVDSTSIYNFGQDPTFAGNKSGANNSEFFYAPPTGFNALSTANLTDPTIKKPHKYFNTKTYDDGSGAKTFGAADAMQPNLVWVKSRGSAYSHKLTDSLRGTTKALSSDGSGAETTDSTGLTAFGSDGFTVGADSNYSDQTGDGMAAWAWKEDATAGMDIITWTGNTSTNQSVNHGLGVAPDFILAKARTGNGYSYYGTEQRWCVYHKSLSSGDILYLNENWAKTSASGVFNSVGNSNISFGRELSASYQDLNFEESGYTADNYVAYLFSEVVGYSFFGSYTGNGISDGPFVWTNHRPAWLLIRRADSTGDDWTVYDNARSSYNAVDDIFYANTNGTESQNDTSHAVDFLSNGFKCRGTSVQENASGVKYVFAAFAESPFKYANAR